MSADFEQVMAQCSRGCFTGLLRVRTREGNGEVRFLSGIQDGVRFDAMEGDAALERLATASEPEFEAISSLPPIDFSSSEPVPPEGGLDRYHAAQLMRYCESNSLTCALELEVKGRVLTARYRLGELLSVEPDSEHTARLAEAKEGTYRFRLPRFELPANVQQRRSVPAAAPKAAPVPKPAAAPVAAKPAPVAAMNPGVAKPAPAAAAKPAPAINPGVAKHAPMPVAKPAPAPTAASLAETPVVALKQVAIVTPVAGPVAARAARMPGDRPGADAPGKAPASLPPAAPKVAASGAARPAADVRPAPSPARGPAPAVPPLGSAPAPRREATLIGPSVAPQPGRGPVQPAPHVPAAAHASAGARASGAAAAAGAASAGAGARAAAPRSPIPSAPPSVPPQSKPAQLQGLWADAVKPPPQSAPVELDSSLRAGASGPHISSAGPKGLGRIEGLSSIAYTPETAPTPTRAAPRSSTGYWALAIAVLVALAAAGWFAFAR